MAITNHTFSKHILKALFFIFISLLIISCEEESISPDDDTISYDSEIASFPGSEAYSNAMNDLLEASKKKLELAQLEILNQKKRPSTIEKSNKNVIRVPKDYASIQAAVDAAQDGATIKVSGTYEEHVIISGRNDLSIISDDDDDDDRRASIITLSDSPENFTIEISNSSNIEIKDFNIIGGIFIILSEQIKVINNNLSGGFFGVKMIGSNNCQIDKNAIKDGQGDNFGEGGGIICESCNFNRVIDNKIKRHRVGIEFLFGSSNNVFQGNKISDTRWTGISLVFFVSQNELYKNTLNNTGFGGLTFFWECNENEINGLKVTNVNALPVFGEYAVGIGLGGANRNNISNVTTHKNSNGMGIRFSEGNIISNLRSNKNDTWGLILEASTSDNTILNSRSKGNGECDLSDLGTNNSIINSRFKTTCN